MDNKHLFEAKNIVTGYDKKIIIDGVDITIPSNKISVIIGLMPKLLRLCSMSE